MQFGLFFHLGSCNQDLSVNVYDGRSHLFCLFYHKSHPNGAFFVDEDSIAILGKLGEINEKLVQVCKYVLNLKGFALEKIGDSSLITASAMWMPQKENQAL